MALINCKECGKEISDTAKVCVNCGAKTEKAKTKSKKTKLYCIILIIIILIVSSIVLINNNNVIIKNKNQAISLFKQYKNNEIDTEKLVNELEQLADDVELLSDTEEDEHKSNELHLLSLTITGITINIDSKYLKWNSYEDISNSKIDSYIQEIKDL